MICQLFTSLEFELDEEKKFINSQREVLFMISVEVDIWMPSEYPNMNTFAAVQSVFFLNSASSSLSLRFHVVESQNILISRPSL